MYGIYNVLFGVMGSVIAVAAGSSDCLTRLRPRSNTRASCEKSRLERVRW
jgi:uncharacterized membrane protein